MDIMRTRYFFHGLTEEVVKRTVPGWGLDTAFAFTSHEDGGAGGGAWNFLPRDDSQNRSESAVDAVPR